MGQPIIDLEHVFARRIEAGDALGFDRPTQAISIATTIRCRNEDQIVLTLDEAKKLVEAVQAHLAEE